MTQKVKGTNKGFKIEKQLVQNLNGNCFAELDKNHKKIIKKSFEKFNENKKITCSSVAGINKPDFEIKIENKKNSYSFKTGSGNSIHQESLKTFLAFCRTLEGSSQNLIECIKFFIWTDGTTDGTGRIQDRMKKEVLREKYPEKLSVIKKFFFKNKIRIIERILFSGRKSNKTDYFIYKKEDDSYIIEKGNKVLEKFENSESRIYGLGSISFQTWNPALKGQTKKPRNVVQFKWSKIEKDLEK